LDSGEVGQVMSNPDLAHVLTPPRRATLRLISEGAIRRQGMPWEPQRQQLDWLADHGYIELGPPPAPTTRGKMQKVRRSMEVTAKGWEALGAAGEGVEA
jgi:hypothetical protein